MSASNPSESLPCSIASSSSTAAGSPPGRRVRRARVWPPTRRDLPSASACGPLLGAGLPHRRQLPWAVAGQTMTRTGPARRRSATRDRSERSRLTLGGRSRVTEICCPARADCSKILIRGQLGHDRESCVVRWTRLVRTVRRAWRSSTLRSMPRAPCHGRADQIRCWCSLH